MSAAPQVGRELLGFAAELYPICRSITGNGLRETLRRVQARIPLKIHEVPSGTRVFDWEVPPEWNIEGASIRGPDGRTVVDFRNHNLHVVNYSEPVDTQLDLEELKRHLHVHARNPDWIPYRTSYYARNWGFCLPRRTLEDLPRGRYRAVVSSRLEPGALSYGEFFLRVPRRGAAVHPRLPPLARQ
jgi:aminopeptidase-like protein